MPKNAIKSIRGFGDWLKKYGEAIFKTRPCYPYKKDNIFYTQTKNCIYVVAKNFNPDFILCDDKIAKVEFLNCNCTVGFEKTADGITLDVSMQTDEEFRVFKLYKSSQEG